MIACLERLAGLNDFIRRGRIGLEKTSLQFFGGDLGRMLLSNTTENCYSHCQRP